MPEPERKREDGLTLLVRCKNHRAFLPRSLRSALDTLDRLEENGFSGEILVLDDASLDGSQKLLRSVQALYNDSRLGALCLAERLGPAGLRDLGLRESTFRYVCVMDADDELLPDNVPLLLRSLLDTGAAMAYGNLIDKEDGEVTGVRSNMAAVPGLNKVRYVDAFSLLDAEKILNQNFAADEDSQGSEGWDMALRLLAGEEPVTFVPVVLGYRHKHSMSVSSLRPPEEEVTTPRRSRDRPGVRERSGKQIGRTYHPDAGFLDG